MQGYLYDPHTHTAETSKCGHLPAADVVERYVKHGFSGLVVTDHLHPEYLSRIDTEHDWQKAMDHYLSGYKASKKRGDELGFDVILGAELHFPQNDNDYLVYGIDEDWLRSNPYMCCTSAREFYEKFHNEVLIIHAHPYRDGNTTVFAIPTISVWPDLTPTRTVMRPVRAASCRSGSGTPSSTRQ